MQLKRKGEKTEDSFWGVKTVPSVLILLYRT